MSLTCHSTVLLQEREDLSKQSAKLRAAIVKDELSLAAVDRAVLRRLIEAPAPLETEALLAAIYEAKVDILTAQSTFEITNKI